LLVCLVWAHSGEWITNSQILGEAVQEIMMDVSSFKELPLPFCGSSASSAEERKKGIK